MKYIIFSVFSFCFLLHASIYDYKVTGANGSEIDFNDFRGKKILIVNIATGSDKISQLTELQQLHQSYGDSLVVIGFPSNSFGHESRTNTEIHSFCTTQYGVTFPLAEKGVVNGNNPQQVYKWLTKISNNGQLDSEVKDDFQKYLIDSQGELIGVFKGAISPLDSKIITALTGSFN